MVSIDALRGYVLEEAIAQMLSSCGYRLLNKIADDPEALSAGGHGLLVRGRGADHQADALGELVIPTPFSLPMRLFAEAKFHQGAVGLAAVRNALGVINDVNERYRQDSRPGRVLPVKRYYYRYSLFSASGFTADAQSFAIAQQISLIDLRGRAFDDLRSAVEDATTALYNLAQARGLTSGFPVQQVRIALRLALGTWDREQQHADAERMDRWARARRAALRVDQVLDTAGGPNLPVEQLAEIAADLDTALTTGFVLAFPDLPFVLALRPENDSFYDFLDRGRDTREIRLRFQYDEDDDAGDWVLSAAGEDRPLARFGIPPVLDAWVLAEDGEQRERARHVKRNVLSTMTVYRGDRAIQLQYTPFTRQIDDVDYYANERLNPLRQQHRLPEEPRLGHAYEISGPQHPPPDIHAEYAKFADAPPWSMDGLRLLLERLDQEAPVQAAVLRATARSGGVLPRRDVYRLAGYPGERSLRGFTRPIRRICNEFVHRGLVPEEALYPLSAWYPRPGRAAWFMMPPDVVELLRRMDENLRG